MASKVQICNMALSRLGANTLVSLTDTTSEAILCNTLFDTLAERVMIQGSWTSVIFRADLARTTNTPTFGYTYEYQLPVNPKCLKVIALDEESPGDIDYQVEGDKILTDEESISIKYIGKVTNTEEFDALLTESIEILLASYLALPITGNAGLAAELKREYMETIINNLAINNQQGSQQVVISDSLIEIR
jgi:hypothetical protein